MATESVGGVLAGARPLRDAFGEMVWTRPGLFKRELRLEAGSELLAMLRWAKMFSFEAQAESGDGRWIIGRRGSLRGPTVVRDAATGADVAVFQRNWKGKGVVRFTAGPEFQWTYEGFWRPTYHWSPDGEKRLVSFTSTLGFKDLLAMEVAPEARELEELPVLALLGAYVMRMLAAERHAH